MKTAYAKVVLTMGLIGVSAVALAGEPTKAPPQEPVGFITGGIIGAFAGGPIGAVVGAGLGTWLGNRVHRAAQAGPAEAKVVVLESDNAQMQIQMAELQTQKIDLTKTNLTLTSRIAELSHSIEAAQNAKDEVAGEEAAKILDGLEGDVLFRTGSYDVTPEMAQAITVLANAVAKSPALKVRVDGYADPRGSDSGNLKLSQQRADAVRDLFVAAGVSEDSLEINAYGKTQSAAADIDGYALERRVRLTLQAQGEAAVARVDTPPVDGALLQEGDNR